MRIIVQRVLEASVVVDGKVVGAISHGLLVLLGCEASDAAADIEWLATRLVNLRVFDDEGGVMNRSVREVGGGLLLVSQFTLLASTKQGTRPSWHRAARLEVAGPLYEAFHCRLTEQLGKPVPTGIFGAHMRVTLVNDGPVTLILDSKLRE